MPLVDTNYGERLGTVTLGVPITGAQVEEVLDLLRGIKDELVSIANSVAAEPDTDTAFDERDLAGFDTEATSPLAEKVNVLRGRVDMMGDVMREARQYSSRLADRIVELETRLEHVERNETERYIAHTYEDNRPQGVPINAGKPVYNPRSKAWDLG